MRTMTCRQLGGPCDLALRGDTADDVIKAQDQHLEDVEKAGDASHQEAREAMKSRWRHPEKSMDWYRDAKTAFSEPPRSDPLASVRVQGGVVGTNELRRTEGGSLDTVIGIPDARTEIVMLASPGGGAYLELS